MSDKLGVVCDGGKFIVTKNGKPILLPKTDGQTIVTEFDTQQDAETYIAILNNLKKQKKYS